MSVLAYPHQLVVMNNNINHLQKEIEELKKFTKNKVIKITEDIDELRTPLNEAVNDLKKENESFMRELDRLDHQYKKLFVEYLESLQQQKQALEQLKDVEKRFVNPSNSSYINNATIQFFGNSTNPATPMSAVLSPANNQILKPTLDPSLNLDFKAFNLNFPTPVSAASNLWKRKRAETTPGKIEDLDLKVA